jgi:hypothetical protein
MHIATMNIILLYSSDISKYSKFEYFLEVYTLFRLKHSIVVFILTSNNSLGKEKVETLVKKARLSLRIFTTLNGSYTFERSQKT